MKWQIGQWVDFKDEMDKWQEAQIIEKRPYSKSAGNFIDDPFEDSDSDSHEQLNKNELRIQYISSSQMHQLDEWVLEDSNRISLI